MRRATILALLAATVLVVAGYSASWFIAARHVVGQLEDWLAAPHGRIEIAIGTITVSGFPTRLEVTATPVQVRLGREFGYTADALVLSRPLRSEDLAFAVRGQQSFTVLGTRIAVQTEATVGEVVRRADGTIAAFRVGATGLTAQGPNREPVQIKRLDVRASSPEGTAGVPDGATLAVRAEAVAAPGRALLGDRSEEHTSEL